MTLDAMPANGWELIGVALITLSAVVVAWLQNRKSHNDIRQIKNNVQNGHATPLRDDLDDVLSEIRLLRADVTGLHEEVRDERQDRRLVTRDTHERLTRIEGRIRLCPVHE